MKGYKIFIISFIGELVALDDIIHKNKTDAINALPQDKQCVILEVY